AGPVARAPAPGGPGVFQELRLGRLGPGGRPAGGGRSHRDQDMNHEHDYAQAPVRQLRADLALALRAAAHFGLSEGVCNHFSVELPDRSRRFLLNPRGLLWQEVQADDIVMVDTQGRALAGRHPVESTAMHIHAGVHRVARQAVVLHTHMPYATALTLARD